MIDEDIVQRFARNVRARRVQLGMTQAQLGERIGIHQPNVRRLESGLSEPLLGTVAKVAEALNTTPCKLLLGEHERISRKGA